MENYSNDYPSSLMRSSSTSKSPIIPRSFMQKSSSHRYPTQKTTASNFKSPLSRSSSQKSSSSKSASSLSRSSSQKCSNFARKCGSLAKEQRAKFYIVKRCIKMLVSWRKQGD